MNSCCSGETHPCLSLYFLLIRFEQYFMNRNRVYVLSNTLEQLFGIILNKEKTKNNPDYKTWLKIKWITVFLKFWPYAFQSWIEIDCMILCL